MAPSQPNGCAEPGRGAVHNGRPDGAEKSMVYNKEPNKWEPRPKVSKDAETQGKTKSSKRGPSEDGSKFNKGREKDTSKAAKGTTEKAQDVKEELSEEKSVKESQPVNEKVAAPKASSEKGPVTGAKESPRSARSAVVLKSAADPAVKEKADAVLGKEDPGAKAPRP